MMGNSVRKVNIYEFMLAYRKEMNNNEHIGGEAKEEKIEGKMEGNVNNLEFTGCNKYEKMASCSNKTTMRKHVNEKEEEKALILAQLSILDYYS